MQDNIPDALIAAFERHYSLDWNDPAMRNERLAWRAAWAAAMESKQCLHQIQEPEDNVWPCVNIDVDESGNITNAKLYSPGLPAGNHDVYPVRVPYMDEHTEAWRACVDELEKAVPGFMSLGNMNGIECAVAAIRGLSERAKHQEPAAAEQAAWHAGLDEGRAQAAGQELKAQHSTACLYGYALARLGLTDTPQMRVLFWDAHEALEWDENTDRYITPSAEGECGQCGHVHEPASSKAATAAVAVPDERVAFEEWALRCAVNVMYCEPDNQYLKTSTELLWQCWKARAALAATPAAAVPLPLLVRDIARELGITCAEACLALKPLGNFSTNTAVTAEMMAKLRECFPVRVPASEVAGARERMTAGRACYFMERFLKEEKLLGPNEQAALHYVIDMLEAAAAPVVLPELGEIDNTAPERIYLVVNPIGNPEDRSGSFSNCSEVSWCATSQGGVEVAYVRADRALLATATGLPAQAVDALTEIVGCIDAANAEGLDDALVNNTDARLADLVQRRLLPAFYTAIAAQSEQPAAPQAQKGQA